MTMQTDQPFRAGAGAGDGDGSQGKAQQVAAQAQETAQEVAGQAQEKAQAAAGQAQAKLREQLDQRSSQLAEQINQQASDLRSVSSTLREQGSEGPAKAADRLAEYAQKVGGYLHDKDSDALLRDLEELGRRQPAALAAGGLLAGFVASRFLKASSKRRYSSAGSASTSPTPAAPLASPTPPAPPAPPTPPVPPRGALVDQAVPPATVPGAPAPPPAVPVPIDPGI